MRTVWVKVMRKLSLGIHRFHFNYVNIEYGVEYAYARNNGIAYPKP